MAQQFGRYQVIEKIGEGGMGQVVLARDPKLGRKVALKLLPFALLNDPAFHHRFTEEAQLIASLRHPAVVTVHDFGEDNGQPYMVMELMSGGTLAQKLAEQPQGLGFEETIRIIRRIAGALDKAHQMNIIHRDIKPENILFDEEQYAYLADFGIARFSDYTQVMTIVGTPHYMSPEQANGLPVNARTDIYQLAVVTYEMLAGRPPFEAPTPMALLHKHAYEPVPRISETGNQLPRHLNQVMEKALAKDPADRYQSASEFVEHLAQWGRRTEILTDPNFPGRQQKAARSRGWLAAGGGLILLSLLVLGFFIFNPGDAEEGATAFPEEPTTPADDSAAADPADAEQTVASVNPSPTPLIVTPTPIPPTPTVTLIPMATAVTASTPTRDQPSPAANAVLGDLWVRPTDGMRMLFVPAGNFLMGSSPTEDPNAFDNEFPKHAVSLDSFWIDQTEVTNTQFATFLNVMGNQQEGGSFWYDVAAADAKIYSSSGSFLVQSGFANHPVLEVSWFGASAYCQWVGGTLPTEAQWEYAARGPSGSFYPWGNGAPDCGLAQYGFCAGTTIPAGSLSPAGNSWAGAQDMAGNVWEWTADFFDETYYQVSPGTNPTGPTNGDSRVLRGGSWASDPEFIRSANRFSRTPDHTNQYIGFRCVLSPAR